MPSLRTLPDPDTPIPAHVVWEITLKCDHACAHCGSRAVKARPDELTSEELFETAHRLADLGAREVTLIGGEAYLRPECVELVRLLAQRGVHVTMQTGGRGVTAALARALADAGLATLGVSVDGPAEAHDVLRNAPGSFRSAVAALGHARDVGLVTAVNTQLNALTLGRLGDLYPTLRDLGVAVWRGQVTVPMGRAADHPDWLLQPWQILAALDELAALQRRAVADADDPRRAMNVTGSNNTGYFGPHEELLRSAPGTQSTYWGGCPAGTSVMSVESDGVVKACPSLPTAPYEAGNVRTDDLAALWDEHPRMTFTRTSRMDELWGFCAGCYFAEACQGGCAWSAHAALGRRGNQPWCYHRAATLRKAGRRERLVPVEAAQGRPYDLARFELVEEPWEDGRPTR